jgi:hypothetical protein
MIPMAILQELFLLVGIIKLANVLLNQLKY